MQFLQLYTSISNKVLRASSLLPIKILEWIKIVKKIHIYSFTICLMNKIPVKSSGKDKKLKTKCKSHFNE